MLVVLALIGSGAPAQDKTEPQSTKARVEELLARIAAAKTDAARGAAQAAAQKELRDLGEKAVPHLQSIVRRGTLAEEVLAHIERSKLPTVENKTLRARAELTVHGPGSSAGKPTPPIFDLWLEIENLTGAKVTLARPTIPPTTGKFRVDRWYPEGGAGKAWDGVLEAGEKKAIYVIGEAGDETKAGDAIAAKVSLTSLEIEVKATAQEGLHSRCPCGCDRSEKMVAELDTTR